MVDPAAAWAGVAGEGGPPDVGRSAWVATAAARESPLRIERRAGVRMYVGAVEHVRPLGGEGYRLGMGERRGVAA